ncbi:MAG: phage Gp37/Gp68 family protein [Parvularcula sp.]|jgi:protein gp37|nr:phage Gp37/Gp68 family protein [Parvularcula sp.]
MAKNSQIEWTDHTFNPWWGCTKVSPACEHCYAEAWAKRLGKKVWGKRSDRRLLSDVNWAQPLKWNAEAAEEQERARVFCASMADVFEDRPDLDSERARLWELIEKTPWLDWLLLTKRPQLILDMVPWSDGWPQNVWIGTTVEDQRRARERLPHLAALPAAVRFISAEPLLGPLDLSPWKDCLDWVITGGESGGHSRPTDPSWFEALRDQCIDAGVAFHFKQWGDWRPVKSRRLQPREVQLASGSRMLRVGKKQAGRRLAGATWDELPTPRRVRQAAT